jgi:hypothetical protein
LPKTEEKGLQKGMPFLWLTSKQDYTTRTTFTPLQTVRKLKAYIKRSIKKLKTGTNTAPASNPTNHGNIEKSQLFIFDDLTLGMINVLCANKKLK